MVSGFVFCNVTYAFNNTKFYLHWNRTAVAKRQAISKMDRGIMVLPDSNAKTS